MDFLKQITELANQYKALSKEIKAGNTQQPLTAARKLGASVGAGGKNAPADVKLVQELLNSSQNAKLTEDGAIGPATIAAIAAFQKKIFNGWSDGKIDVGGSTWQRLSANSSTPVTPTPTDNSTPVTPVNTDPAPVKPVTGGNIKKAVGKGQPNEERDLLIVQSLLKKSGINCPVTGVYDAATEAAIGKATADFIISPKGGTIAKLLMKNLPDLGKPADVQAKSTAIKEQAGCIPNNQPTIPQQIVVAAGNGVGTSAPVLVLIGGMHGCSGQFMIDRTPSSLYSKAVVIGAGYNAVWKQIEQAYQQYLGTTNPLPMSACSICGFSKGGQTVQTWGVGKFKKVGLIDPVTALAWAQGYSSKVILSCNFAGWARQNSAEIMKVAAQKGATVEETAIGHMKYVEYFLSQFGGDLV